MSAAIDAAIRRGFGRSHAERTEPEPKIPGERIEAAERRIADAERRVAAIEAEHHTSFDGGARQPMPGPGPSMDDTLRATRQVQRDNVDREAETFRRAREAGW
jgi:hypothetical protein